MENKVYQDNAEAIEAWNGVLFDLLRAGGVYTKSSSWLVSARVP
jgi:hypothetical protein